MNTVPIGRILEKLDQYLSTEDYSAAEKHLSYWFSEAEACADERGAVAILNEQIGLFRKTLQEEKAMEAVQKTLDTVHRLTLEDSVSGATAFINAATAYKCFGYWDKALPLYEAAKRIYERDLSPMDRRLGGLYNNMALALTDAGAYADAKRLYLSALQVMGNTENGELECAITWLNLAELQERADGEEISEKVIYDCLEHAETCLRAPTVPKNTYYAFVAEKCAPAFDYYGYFAFAEELRITSMHIRKGEAK